MEKNAQPQPEAQIVDNFQMPSGARTGARGSKFYPNWVEEAITKLTLNQTAFIPHYLPVDGNDGVSPAKHRSQMGVVLKNYLSGTGKTFAVGLIPKGAHPTDKEFTGIAVKLTAYDAKADKTIVQPEAKVEEKKAA